MPKHEPLMTGTRVCRTCGEEKSVLDFYVARTSRDGRRVSCKSCESAINQRRRSNPAVRERYRMYAENYRMTKESEARRRWNAYSCRRRNLGLPLLGEPVVTMPGLIELHGPDCFYCLKPLRFDILKSVEVDHIIPIGHPDSRHDYSMVVVSCKPCNRNKFNHSLEEWKGETEAAWLWQRIAEVQHRVPDVMRFV